MKRPQAGNIFQFPTSSFTFLSHEKEKKNKHYEQFLNVTMHGFNGIGKESEPLNSKHSRPLKVSLFPFIGVFVTSLKKKLAFEDKRVFPDT